MTDQPRRSDRQEPIISDLVEYLLVVIPDLTSLSSVVAAFDRLARSTAIRILDLVVVVREHDRGVTMLEPEDLEKLSAVPKMDRTIGRWLSEGDLTLISSAVPPGTVGVVVVTEDRWATDLSVAARSAGGRVLAGERIPPSRITAMLAESTETEPEQQ